jgi:hypothetical protein
VRKEHILEEIRRTTAANSGVPLGHVRFFHETGIRYVDWHGKYWSRWGDALKEAGFEPNTLQAAYSEGFVLEKLALLARQQGHLPTVGEMKLHKRIDPTFPNTKVYERLGRKHEQVAKLAGYCRERPEFADVLAICQVAAPAPRAAPEPEGDDDVEIGFVYLLKSGRYYKVGKSNAAGRREREIALQLPERVTVIHTIRTDDPSGIEEYWHRRFESQRLNGEWFDLTAAAVRAFRRRKFM